MESKTLSTVKPGNPKDAQGKPISPITYNGTTYLPVRAVGEVVGKDVGWDATTQTVKLGDEYDVVLEFPADRFHEQLLILHRLFCPESRQSVRLTVMV